MKEFMNPQVNVLKYTLADVIATSDAITDTTGSGGLTNGGDGNDATTGNDYYWGANG